MRKNTSKKSNHFCLTNCSLIMCCVFKAARSYPIATTSKTALFCNLERNPQAWWSFTKAASITSFQRALILAVSKWPWIWWKTISKKKSSTKQYETWLQWTNKTKKYKSIFCTWFQRTLKTNVLRSQPRSTSSSRKIKSEFKITDNQLYDLPGW